MNLEPNCICARCNVRHYSVEEREGFLSVVRCSHCRGKPLYAPHKRNKRQEFLRLVSECCPSNPDSINASIVGLYI